MTDKLNILVQKFTSDVSNLIREEALAAASAALGSNTKVVSLPPKQALKKIRAIAKKPATGEKRDPKVIAKLVERLGAFIAKKPGLRIEQIGAALKTPTKGLTLPVKKLLAQKTIKTKGQKRATVYLPR